MKRINQNEKVYNQSKSSVSRTPVTVIGLGMLGSALASAFLNHNHPTTVWNRTANKADDLVTRGAVRVDSVTEAVEASKLVVICVSDYEGVREILAPSIAKLSGRLLVNLSSGTPEQAREIGNWAKEHNVSYLDGAAMSGTRLVGKPEAVFLYSGSSAAFTEYEETLRSLGNAMYLDADFGLASLYDTALFGMNWGVLIGFYHAVALLGTEQVDPIKFASIATEYTPFVIGLMSDHARQIKEGHYPKDDGTLEVHMDAMDHLVHTSQANGISTDVPNLIKTLLERGIATGHSSDGIASLIEVIKKPTPSK
ncbi:NAD(P)-dependent oxidoreductase [Rossellomorea sp. BNER]|uniref:NAD(P)-dependent oxidoreductase n=1 Tax=Rossellomorea sp. BNER TaxID=2962031 RepID=UPI003AF234FA